MRCRQGMQGGQRVVSGWASKVLIPRQKRIVRLAALQAMLQQEVNYLASVDIWRHVMLQQEVNYTLRPTISGATSCS